MRWLRRRREDGERGAVAVEFAVIFCFVVIPLVLGIIEFGYYFYASSTTASATRETARRLAVGDCATATKATAYAKQQSNLNGMSIEFGATSPYSNTLPTVGSQLTVRGTAPGQLFSFFPIPNNGIVTKVVTTRVEDTTEDSPC